jgi:transcription initiation factor TFIID subunit 5
MYITGNNYPADTYGVCGLCVVCAGACVRVLTSQTSCVTCLGFSPDGQQLAAGTEDGTVAVYDLGSARR